MARLARGDVNLPDFDGFPIERQVPEARFEAAVYELLRPESDIRATHLLCYRTAVKCPGPRLTVPLDLTGRRLFVFERAEGVNNVWEDLSANSKVWISDQLSTSLQSIMAYLPLPASSP